MSETNKAGRPKRFTTNQLMDIINLYFNNNVSSNGQLTATELANYANNFLGYKDIRYNHFTRDTEIKKFIDNYNHANPFSFDGKKQDNYVTLNVDKFMKAYGNDKKVIGVTLKAFKKKYIQYFDETVRLREENERLKNELKQAKEEFNNSAIEQKLIITELKAENAKLAEQNSVYRKHVDLDNQIKMIEYLKQKGFITELDKDNVTLMLKKSNQISRYD